MKNDKHKDKKKIAKAIKSMFDYLSATESGDIKKFKVEINNKTYDNIDIAKIISTFSDTLDDEIEPQIEIISAVESEPLPFTKAVNDENKVDKAQKKEISWLSYLGDRHGYFFHESEQLSKETDILYIKLCRLINRLYVERGSSFRKVANRYMDDFFYANPYVSIYRIAQQYILSYYRYGTLPTKYYELKTIADYFDKSIEKAMVEFMKKHVKGLSAPTAETLKMLGLTAYGTAPLWWDNDGALRARGVFTAEQAELLSLSDKRSTKLWAVPEISVHMLKTYLTIYRQLNQMMKQRERAEEINAYLLGPISDETPFIRGYINKSVYASAEWLRVVESKYRNMLPKLKPLDEEKTWHDLSFKFPLNVIEEIEHLIENALKQITEQEFIAMCDGYLRVNSEDWSFAGQYIAQLTPVSAVQSLIKYQSHKLSANIAGKVIKITQDQEVLRAALFLKAKQSLVKSEEKLLKSVIHSSNLALFNECVKTHAVLDENLIEQLNALKLVTRKTIDLSEQKLGHAKVSLKTTTEIVQDYLGDAADDVDSSSQPLIERLDLKADADKKMPQKEQDNVVNSLLVKLLEGALDLEQLNPFAAVYGKPLNIMLDDINQIFYLMLDDQVIIQEGSKVRIDEFYIEDVKTFLQ